MNSYGIRKCMFCEEEFEALKPGQVTCSEKCRKARRRTLKKENEAARWEAPWEAIEWLNCKLEEMIANSKKACADEAHKEPAHDAPKQAENTEAKTCGKHRHICGNCGSTFKSPYKDDSYCCDQCAKEAVIVGM